MRIAIEPTFWARIYISGPLDIATQVCREECLRDGLCVTIERTRFVYTGGEEGGVVVGLIQYPRFPKDESAIVDRARLLAERLLDALHQHSVLVMTPHETTWLTRRPE